MKKNKPPPKRRPIGLTTDAYEDAAARFVPVTTNGDSIFLAARDAHFEKLWLDALSGNRRAMAEIIRRERQYEPPEFKAEDETVTYGYLAVPAPMTEDEWVLIHGGLQPQPTLPILEQFRAELGLAATPGYTPP